MGSVHMYTSAPGYIPAKCGGETRGGGGAHDVVAQARGGTDMALHKGSVVSAQWSRGKILALGTSVRLQGIPGSNPGWAPFCLLLPSLLPSLRSTEALATTMIFWTTDRVHHPFPKLILGEDSPATTFRPT